MVVGIVKGQRNAVEIGKMSGRSRVEGLGCDVVVVKVLIVVDIVVGGSSSLFGGLRCKNLEFEMVWQKMCVVVWFECVGMFVVAMKMFGVGIVFVGIVSVGIVLWVEIVFDLIVGILGERWYV